MSAASITARGQARAQALLMNDACTIRRRTGDGPAAADGSVSPTYTTLYTGQCRVQQVTTEPTAADAGEDRQLLIRLTVQLPISVTGLEAADEITITAAAHDADLVGRTFLINGLHHKSNATSRRVGVIERTH
jgi:hypothetical protein